MSMTASLALTVDFGTAGTLRVDAEFMSYAQLLEVLRVLEPIAAPAAGTGARSEPEIGTARALAVPNELALAVPNDRAADLVRHLVTAETTARTHLPVMAVEPEPVPEPEVKKAPALQCLEPGCDHPGGFASPQALGAHRRYKHGPGYRAQARTERVAAAPEADVDLPDPAPAPTEKAPTSEPENIIPGNIPAPAGAAVILCGCGHAERLHERDAILGRGACHRGACGCSEYRPAA